MTVTPQHLGIMEGSSGSYTVVLTARPSAEVTIDIGGHDGTDVSVDQSTLTFTAANWNLAQTVTVGAAQDDDAATDSVTLNHTVKGGDYQGVVAWFVTVTITDDDSAGVSIDPVALTVTEGGSGAYTVVLDSQPTADVTVTVSGQDGTDLSAGPVRADLHARELGDAPDGHRQRGPGTTTRPRTRQ